MIIEIESYKGDTLLSGKQITYTEFVRQIQEIESDYDRILDNFTALLCRRYGWTVIENNSNPSYIYDRDTEKILRMQGRVENHSCHLHALGDTYRFRLAKMQDLPQLKKLYFQIIAEMNQNKISIWDDIYPCGSFEEDIIHDRLYLITNHTEILSAFALCDSNSGENAVAWKDPGSKALYLDRLGVNPRYLRKGIGRMTLTRAQERARVLGAEYLRLFVVDINTPAIQLYDKNGFTRVNGIYDEVLDPDYTLHEFGYEIKL